MPDSSRPPTHRLLRAARKLREIRTGRTLPLSSSIKILPGESHQLRARSQVPHLFTDHLLVAEPQKWQISSLSVGPRVGGTQIHGSHPALLDPGPGSIAKLPRLPVEDQDIKLQVRYMGSEASGEYFTACLYLRSDSREETPKDLPTPAPAARSFVAVSAPLPRGTRIDLTLPARAHDLHISDLLLCVAEPAHWLVSDISIDGNTLLVESSELPGELLTRYPGRAELRLGHLRARGDLTVQATYTGPLPTVALSYEVLGSEVPADDTAADSAFLPMSSTVSVNNEQSLQITGCVEVPRGYAFLPETIVLREPEKWEVNDIKIDNWSQLVAYGNVPGVLFRAGARECHLDFDPIPGGSCLILTATRHDKNHAAGTFICGVVGRVILDEVKPDA